MGRRYPESGPERRERHEFEDKQYGAGEYLADQCRRCKQPFTEADKAEGVNRIVRQVFHSSPGVNPVSVGESGGICTTCRLRERVERLEQDAEGRRRRDRDVARTCQTCGEYYRWVGTLTGYKCRCGSSGVGAFGRAGGPNR
jgi:hypothetical protein